MDEKPDQEESVEEQRQRAMRYEMDRLGGLVAEMRRLGIVKYAGITLGPEPVVHEDRIFDELEESIEESARHESAAARKHQAYWLRVTKGSGAGIPKCSATCACRRAR